MVLPPANGKSQTTTRDICKRITGCGLNSSTKYSSNPQKLNFRPNWIVRGGTLVSVKIFSVAGLAAKPPKKS